MNWNYIAFLLYTVNFYKTYHRLTQGLLASYWILILTFSDKMNKMNKSITSITYQCTSQDQYNLNIEIVVLILKMSKSRFNMQVTTLGYMLKIVKGLYSFRYFLHPMHTPNLLMHVFIMPNLLLFAHAYKNYIFCLRIAIRHSMCMPGTRIQV